MAFQAGTRFTPYEIVSLLGVGGMGEVYLSHDTKLGPDAAIEILPEAFTADPDRQGRFKREAQVLASLDYPNIAAIYGLEDAAGVQTRHMLTISPDGMQIAYVANALYWGSISSWDARPIPGSELDGSIYDPVFSPDGASFAFEASLWFQELKTRVP